MKNVRILLVEDNQDDIMLTLRAFKKNNILNEVIIAKDGVEALEILYGEGSSCGQKIRVDEPLLILLDLKLPKIDGFEVLRRIRTNEMTQLVPVVILTSSKEENDIIESYRCGVNGYVRKPVDFTEFTDFIKNIGLFWLYLNESPIQPRGDLNG